MTRQEIITAVLNGGYIQEVGSKFTVYDPCGRYAGRCVWATAQRVLKEPTVQRIEDCVGYVITTRTSRRASEIENREICKNYADDLEQHADGVVRTCEECRETVYITDDVPVYKCPCCGNVADRDGYEQKTLYDYLVDCYDVEYRIGGDREYRSAEICIALGGPNVYVDTAENAVKLFWGGDRATYYISGSLSDEIDDICAEQYNNI